MKQRKPTIHTQASKLLRRTLLQVKRETGAYNQREVARRLGVNVKYVNDNLIHGKVPANQKIAQVIGVKPGKRQGKPKEKCILCGRMVTRTLKGDVRLHKNYLDEVCDNGNNMPDWLVKWRYKLTPAEREQAMKNAVKER